MTDYKNEALTCNECCVFSTTGYLQNWDIIRACSRHVVARVFERHLLAEAKLTVAV